MELCPGEDLFYWLEHSKPPSTDGKLPTPFQHAVAMTPVKQQIHQLLGGGSPSPSAVQAGSGPHHNNPAPHHGSAPHVSHLSNHLMSALAITPQNNKTHGTPSNSFLHSTLHSTNVSAAYTPPTPSLLSAVPAPLLLSPSRVRLIASMFAQMCAAVQACHDAGVSHRDIKPENVIVTEEKSWRKSRGKVVCKLTDFGLATRDEESEDVECGSRREWPRLLADLFLVWAPLTLSLHVRPQLTWRLSAATTSARPIGRHQPTSGLSASSSSTWCAVTYPLPHSSASGH